MRELLQALWQYRRNVFAGILSLFIVDLGELLIPQVIRRAVDALAAARATPGLLLRYCLLILGLALLAASFRFAWRLFLITAARRYEEYIRNRFYHHLLKLSASFFNRTKTGDLMAHAVNDVDAVRMAMAFGVVALSDTLFISAFALGAMIHISPTLTLYAMIPMPFLTFIVLRFGRLIHHRFEAVQASFSVLTEKVREAISGIRVVKAYGQERGVVRDFEGTNDDFIQKNMALVRVWGMFFPLIMTLAGLATGIVLLIGGQRVILGRISLGEFVAFNAYLGMMTWPMMAIGWAINLIQRGSASMGRIQRILAVVPEIQDVPYARPHRVRGEIEFRNLTFRYGPDTPPVLRDISLRIEAGMTLGIVGRTGAGKSTLVQLIPRIFDPPPGSLWIDGKEVREIRLHDLRRAIGFVPQDPFLFSATIRENIAFGNPEMPMERVIWAAQMAAIHDEILEFPEGYETRVGERGITLSGGQKQRIALARALALDPVILILDDTLSAVDAKTEERILANLREIMTDRTSIVISHRISAIKDADWIVVLDEGEIREQGTHEELLALGGIYSIFYELQTMEEKLEV